MIVALIGAATAVRGFSAQKSTAPMPNASAVAMQKVKELLLLMDTDKNGKISREEWMTFMAAEFDRLDRDKSGELDPKELSGSRVTLHSLHVTDQGK